MVGRYLEWIVGKTMVVFAWAVEHAEVVFAKVPAGQITCKDFFVNFVLS